MTTLCKAAKHMLEVADANQYAVAAQAPHSDVMAYNAAVNNLRTALEREEEASAWLAERKEHWRKEREKAQATKDQDPELSAALGWPGGISDPVLDRKTLLQMVAALRLASQQALEALEYENSWHESFKVRPYVSTIDAITALRAALAQQDEPVQVAERERIASQWEGCVTHQLDTFGPVDIGASIRAGELVEAQQDSACLHGVEDGACKECYATETDLSRCPQCNGPADNGFDRSFPPSPYLCTKCMAKPAQDPTVWVASKDGRVIYDDASKDDSLLRVSGDFENDEQRISYAKQIVDKLNAALAQQDEPLTIERLRYALVASRIIPPAAVEDPDEYDDGVTLFRIEALHRRIT